ncbi:prevent-host-death family protein [Bifidobacterium primatium]|uniref:Antitoxin n=1 Tax=Bifidobacterium primatium TaxID=2045438 RepID=A0A2M9HB38_9BIFI|nr:type II toxin-antitoxin system Phd/YefM family antitoxin [Bifidobacterium primatium]PJM74032.1 prevent-host-death family protein [Bifidobacterium primatium]
MTSILDNLVPVSEFSHGGASRAFNRVGDGNPVVVMKNNKPSAVIISPDDYRRFTEAEENFALYLEAQERLKNDDGTLLSPEEVFGKDYKPADDGYEPEFE